MSECEAYFRYILGEIIPESREWEIKTVGESGSLDLSSTKKLPLVIHVGNKPDAVFRPITIIGKYKSLVSSSDPLGDLVNGFHANQSRGNILATFDPDGSPALVFYPEVNTFYCMFDLEELVCRLSMLQDESGVKDRHGRFLAQYHPNEDRWKVPLLESLGKSMREAVRLPDYRKKWGILMTHDVDRVTVEPTLLIRNFILYRKITKFSLNVEKDMLYSNLKRLAEIDKQQGIESAWFFLSGPYSVRRHGNRYGSDSMKVRKLIEKVIENGHAIGLHMSFYAAFNLLQSQRETEGLKRIYGQAILLNRNHYLRFNMRKSIPLYEKSGFSVDSTLGYSDANGFRAGLCRPFQLWNYETRKKSNVVEVPLLFMDSVHSNNLAESWNDLNRVLRWVKETRGCGTILFHPCSMADNRENQQFYLDAIRECQRLDIPFLSIDDVLDRKSGEITHEN